MGERKENLSEEGEGSVQDNHYGGGERSDLFISYLKKSSIGKKREKNGGV